MPPSALSTAATQPLFAGPWLPEVATPDEPPDHRVPVARRTTLFRTAATAGGWCWQITRTIPTSPRCGRAPRCQDKKRHAEAGGPRHTDLTAAIADLKAVSKAQRPEPAGSGGTPAVDLGADGKFLVNVAGDATEIFDEAARSFDCYLRWHIHRPFRLSLVLSTVFRVRFSAALPLKRPFPDSIA